MQEILGGLAWIGFMLVLSACSIGNKPLHTAPPPASSDSPALQPPAGAPSSAGTAFNQVWAWLVGAQMKTPCSPGADRTWSCALARPNGYTALAVWNDQGPKAYTPGAPYADFRDLTGKTTPIQGGGTVTIGPKPILLETRPAP